MPETFYDVLEVDEDATQGEIEAAYRRKVKETHPDVSEAEDAAEKFRKVVQAEEVLGDPDERETYDRIGHAAYLRRVEGANAAGAERSPWTTADRRDRRQGAGTGGVGAAAGASASGASSSRSSGDTASASSRAGFGVDSSAGVGSAASRQSGASATTGPTGNRWSADAYGAGGTGDDDSSYAVHDWDDETAAPGTVTLQFTQEMMIVTVSMFVLYPLLVWASVSPSFPLIFNAIVGACTLLAVGYMLTVPKMAVTVFGAWSVASPVGVLALTDWGMVPALVAVGVCWVPFAYAVVVAYVTRPG